MQFVSLAFRRIRSLAMLALVLASLFGSIAQASARAVETGPSAHVKAAASADTCPSQSPSGSYAGSCCYEELSAPYFYSLDGDYVKVEGLGRVRCRDGARLKAGKVRFSIQYPSRMPRNGPWEWSDYVATDITFRDGQTETTSVPVGFKCKAPGADDYYRMAMRLGYSYVARDGRTYTRPATDVRVSAYKRMPC